MNRSTNFFTSLIVLIALLACPLQPAAQDGQPQPDDVRSMIQSGLYAAPELNNQGLIIARQGNAVAAYPLIYDEDGDSRWFFSGTLLNDDGTYDADLYALSDGQCLGCPAPMAPPTLEIVGSIAIDGSDPLEPEMTVITGEEDNRTEQTVVYEPVVFGHITYDLYGEKVAGLEGKWALTVPENPDESHQCPQELLGWVFDLNFDHYVDLATRAIITPPAPILLRYDVLNDSESTASVECSAKQYSERSRATDRPFCIIYEIDEAADIYEPRHYGEFMSINRIQFWPFAEPESGLFNVNTDGCTQTAVRVQ